MIICFKIFHKKMYRFIYLLIPFVFMCCNSQITNSMERNFDKSALDYLALGDSYTIGESVPASESFPVQLTKKIRENHFDISDPTIIATTGWTTEDLLNAINQRSILDTFNIVTLLIGVNNQYRGYDIEQYRKEFAILLKKAIIFAGNSADNVFVLSIPDWSVTSFAKGSDREKIAKEIDKYNSLNKEETLKLNAHYINITPISRRAENDVSLIAFDGLHPSGKMYSEWVSLMLSKVIKEISNEI